MNQNGESEDMKEQTTQEESSQFKPLLFVQVVGGDTAQVVQVREDLKKVKEEFGLDWEFMVGDENIKLQDVDKVIEELRKLKEED